MTSHYAIDNAINELFYNQITLVIIYGRCIFIATDSIAT